MTLFRCAACGHTLFPARLLCPRCGGDAWEPVVCRKGLVEAVTADAVRQLASVRVADVVVLARLEGEAEPGDAVLLDERMDGAVVARASGE